MKQSPNMKQGDSLDYSSQPFGAILRWSKTIFNICYKYTVITVIESGKGNGFLLEIVFTHLRMMLRTWKSHFLKSAVMFGSWCEEAEQPS